MTTRFAKSFNGPGNTIDLGDQENAIVMPGIELASTDGFGISGSGQHHHIGVFGSVGGDLGGIAITDAYQTRISVGTQGTVTSDNDAINIGGDDSRIVNHGSIVSLNAYGIEFGPGVVGTSGPPSYNASASVSNFGTISGEYGIYAKYTDLSISNHGTIIGVFGSAIVAEASNSQIKNFGLIVGDIYFTAGINTIYNRGHLEGFLNTGKGVDMVDNRGGTIDGQIGLGDGNDTFIGGGDDEYASGGKGNDVLNGGGGADKLFGGIGDDILIGGAGNDLLSGSAGVDDLTGGTGADIFAFDKAAGLKPAEIDTIRDFSSAEGDTINLLTIDAVKGTKPNDAFTFIDTQAFHNVAGELRYDVTGDHLTVYADMTGDGVADLTFIVFGATGLTAADFVL